MMCIILAICTALVLYADTYRHKNNKIQQLIDILFEFLLRADEKGAGSSKTGASYMFMGLLLTAILFPKGLAINAWLILIVSDSLAAIVGMRFAGYKIYNNKTLEGSIVFFISSVLISVFSYFWVAHYTAFAVIIVSCFITTMVELFSGSKYLKINDNFTIPLSYGLSSILLNLFR
ncbi:MAG TPA: hypothetical protein QKA08_03395 [Candidatus Megaira endosymbiont of Nemacystus decipiens]|nr:hypothetical protein [Candidatus Megaera endosymbiont of Nemacystus decipiens]